MTTTTSPYHMSGAGIPSPDPTAEKSLLLIYLTDLDSAHQEKLVQHLQPPNANYNLQSWHPGHAFLRSLALHSDRRDSQAILYALAIVAYRAGRPGFVVADEATKRRVEGQLPVRGEDDPITVVMVAARPKTDGQLRVIAKRTTMRREENNSKDDDNDADEDDENYERIDLGAAVDSFDITRRSCKLQGLTSYDEPAIYEEIGFELLDPDNLPFTPTTADAFAYENMTARAVAALSEHTPFPPELIFEITSQAQAGLRLGEPIKLPADLDYTFNAPFINILVCFPTTESELEELQSTLQKEVNEEFKRLELKGEGDGEKKEDDKRKSSAPKVHLIAWERDHPPSRRDLTLLREALSGKENDRCPDNVKAPYVLLKPIEGNDIPSCKLLSLCDCEVGLAVFWISLSGILQQNNLHAERWEVLDKLGTDKLEFLPSTFVMSSYDKPFYPTPKAGLPVGRAMISVALIFLTNKLSRDQIEAIYKEIMSEGTVDDSFDNEKFICPVPWKDGDEGAEDATPEEMWRLYLEYKERCEGCIVCIDQQSADDLKVIIMNGLCVWTGDGGDLGDILTDVEYPHERGLEWGRQEGREAHIIWMNLSIANVGFDELFDGADAIQRYYRPDWPYHDRVDESNQWIG